MTGRVVITKAAARVFSRCVIFMKASGRLTEKEWGTVKGYLIRWAKAEGGKHAPPVELEGGPIPENLLRKLGRRDAFKDVPQCEWCGRRVIVPNEESA